jgi:hypothetical protein
LDILLVVKALTDLAKPLLDVAKEAETSLIAAPREARAALELVFDSIRKCYDEVNACLRELSLIDLDDDTHRKVARVTLVEYRNGKLGLIASNTRFHSTSMGLIYNEKLAKPLSALVKPGQQQRFKAAFDLLCNADKDLVRFLQELDSAVRQLSSNFLALYDSGEIAKLQQALKQAQPTFDDAGLQLNNAITRLTELRTAVWPAFSPEAMPPAV